MSPDLLRHSDGAWWTAATRTPRCVATVPLPLPRVLLRCCGEELALWLPEPVECGLIPSAAAEAHRGLKDIFSKDFRLARVGVGAPSSPAPELAWIACVGVGNRGRQGRAELQRLLGSCWPVAEAVLRGCSGAAIFDASARPGRFARTRSGRRRVNGRKRLQLSSRVVARGVAAWAWVRKDGPYHGLRGGASGVAASSCSEFVVGRGDVVCNGRVMC